MKRRWNSLAFRIAFLYAAFGTIWIGASDWVVALFYHVPVATTAANVAKGLGFVGVTAGLLFALLRRVLRVELEARAQAEATARQLDELRAIAEQSGEILYKHGTDHRATYVSPQCRTLLGYGPEDLAKQWTAFLTSNPINEKALESTRRALETGQRQKPYVIEVRRKDGTPVLLEVDESPYKDREGKVLAIVGAARDVTERERAQQTLRESEERFRQLTQAISEVFWMGSLEFDKLLYVSPAYETVWGRTCESLYQNPRSWLEAVHPEDRQQVEAAFTLDRGRREIGIRFRITRPDGTVRWILDRAFPVQNEAGEPVGLAGVAKDITERIKAEETLRESESRLRAIYNSMNEGLALCEVVRDAAGAAVDYRWLDLNPAYAALTGLTRERTVGVLASELYGQGKAPHLEEFARVAAAGEPVTFETLLAGVERHVIVSAFSPRPGQFAMILTDITRRKEAERQVATLNQVYALVSHINEAIVRVSDQETLLRETCCIATEHGELRLAWIGLVEERTGVIQPVAWAGNEGRVIAPSHRDQPLLGAAVREGRVVIVPDLSQAPEMAPFADPDSGRALGSAVALPLSQGGRTVGALYVYAAEPRYFSGLITEALVEVAADISFGLDLIERNRQREREQHQLRLQQSALEAAANAIVITDRNGEIQWVNDAFTRLTGYSSEDARGAYPRILKSGVHGPAFYEQLWRMVLSGSVWHGELTNRRKDGTLYEEEATITPVRDHSGEITHFVAIKQDVTERKRLEQQFLRAQRMQSVGLLAGGMAHDLNNVLAPVLLALPLLRTERDPGDREHILDTLEQSVKRGASIVRQVLTFARGVEVQRVQVQAGRVIRDLIRIAEETFPRDIVIRSSVPANLWALLGDPTQLHQVLLNLGVNARDAMPDGGQLTFTARNVELAESRRFMGFEAQRGRYVVVSVIDTGTGIAPEHLERIFEPFFTTKPAGKGTGLGLSTVLGIVKSHGGLVEVQSAPGSGSTFSVYLPAAAEVPGQESAPGASAPPPGKGETILVADDESSILQVLRSALAANGYHVLTATDGCKAVAALDEAGTAIKAVVTDIMMPCMDGVAMIRVLRQRYPSLPVIAVTGLLNPPSEPDREGTLRAMGVEHVLRKPFAAEELLVALRRALDGARTDSPQAGGSGDF